MKTYNKFLFIFFLAATCCLSSCKKEGKSKKNCLINNLVISGRGLTENYFFTYNNDDQVATINSNGATNISRNFNYSGNMVIITERTATSGGPRTFVDSVVFDDRDRPVFHRSYNQTRTAWEDYRYFYSGDQMTRIEASANGQATPNITNLSYANGNMTGFITANATSTLEYYMNEENQLGDYLDVATFVENGFFLYPHKNLIKSLADNAGNVTNFTYIKNSEGQITNCTATTGGETTTITLEYQCK